VDEDDKGKRKRDMMKNNGWSNNSDEGVEEERDADYEREDNENQETQAVNSLCDAHRSAQNARMETEPR
jgi:hypothetical protein